MNTNTVNITDDFTRPILPLSTTVATNASSRDIADVSAANTSNTKNIAANTTPIPPILLNTFGKTLKTNPGPPAGSNPQLNTAGKIATPARTAISVSQTVIHTDVFSKLSDTGIYEPYTTMIPIPTDNENKACPNAASTPSEVSLEKSG